MAGSVPPGAGLGAMASALVERHGWQALYKGESGGRGVLGLGGGFGGEGCGTCCSHGGGCHGPARLATSSNMTAL